MLENDILYMYYDLDTCSVYEYCCGITTVKRLILYSRDNLDIEGKEGEREREGGGGDNVENSR